MSENYKYFAHDSCEYFPCHAKADPEISTAYFAIARFMRSVRTVAVILFI